MSRLPIHCFLIGVFPVLCAFSSLVGYLLPEELTIPLIVSVVLTTVILVVSYLLLKNWTLAGVVTSAIILLIFCFDFAAIMLTGLLAKTGGGVLDDRLLLVPYLILMAGLIAVLVRAKTNYKILTTVLNTIGSILVIGHIGYISYCNMMLAPILKKLYAQQDADVQAMKLDPSAGRPDIYYIILDAMGRHDTFKEFYEFDNSSFLSRLEAQGFVIPSRSRSNYPMTSLSLSSSLNMNYLNSLQELLGKESTEYTVLYRIIQRNRVELALKRLGYSYINVSSGFSPTDYMGEADVNLGSRFGNIFFLAFVRTTLFGPLQRNFDFLASLARSTRLYPFENVQEIVKQQAPKFVFIHIVLPHPPFLFKEDGTTWELDRISFSDRFETTKYTKQAIFLQKKVLALIDELNKDGTEKIIIMQGDHGPYAEHSTVKEGSSEIPTRDELRLRMSIFNAYKLPGVDKAKIYDSITPVNTFRLVFNEYFKTNLEILPDESYYARDELPFDMKDVTSLVSPGNGDSTLP